jgi:hypothetical protein
MRVKFDRALKMDVSNFPAAQAAIKAQTELTAALAQALAGKGARTPGCVERLLLLLLQVSLCVANRLVNHCRLSAFFSRA